GLGGGEDELAGGDIHLPAAEIHRIETALHAREDLARVVRAAQHDGVGHARHRDMGVAFASTVAGGAAAHQPAVLPVLDEADEDAVLDQRGAVGGRALVVHGQAAAPVGKGTVIHHGHAG